MCSNYIYLEDTQNKFLDNGLSHGPSCSISNDIGSSFGCTVLEHICPQIQAFWESTFCNQNHLRNILTNVFLFLSDSKPFLNQISFDLDTLTMQTILHLCKFRIFAAQYLFVQCNFLEHESAFHFGIQSMTTIPEIFDQSRYFFHFLHRTYLEIIVFSSKNVHFLLKTPAMIGQSHV